MAFRFDVLAGKWPDTGSRRGHIPTGRATPQAGGVTFSRAWGSTDNGWRGETFRRSNLYSRRGRPVPGSIGGTQAAAPGSSIETTGEQQ
ncbi:hypothetical protein [Bradyrhizobium sp.]